jgi:DNA-directed RNA polymerase subunit D
MIDVEKRVEEEEEEFKMKVELLHKSEKNGTIKVLIKDTNASMLNMYRRFLINDVPSMAIASIEIQDNSSAMYDEMLAHRLGMLVLKTDLAACFLENKNKYTVDLTLEVEGPNTVTAGMISSRDPGVVPVHKDALIVNLLEGQSIKLIATAVTGTGLEHSKFSPGLLFYRKFPHIKDMKKAEKIIMSVSPDKEKFKDSKVNIALLSEGCIALLEEQDLVKYQDSEFLLTIEPWGQLSALEIIEALSKVTNEQLDDLTNSIKKLK